MAPDRPVPRLMLITNRGRSRTPLPELVAAAVAGGVEAVQLREPDLEPAALADLAAHLKELVGARAALLVNGDVGVAAALGLGLHLPEHGPATAAARNRLGDGKLLGRSVHSPAAATAAIGADYLLAGNLFATASKPGNAPLGPDGLAAIVAATWAPVLAVGGIDAGNARIPLAGGAAGIAVVGAIAGAADPERAAAGLRAIVDELVPLEDEMAPAMTAPASVAIVVNGKPVAVEPETTITDFLADKGLRGTMAIVEVNGEIVARRRYDEVAFAPGDRVEVVQAVGGG